MLLAILGLVGWVFVWLSCGCIVMSWLWVVVIRLGLGVVGHGVEWLGIDLFLIDLLYVKLE